MTIFAGKRARLRNSDTYFMSDFDNLPHYLHYCVHRFESCTWTKKFHHEESVYLLAGGKYPSFVCIGSKLLQFERSKDFFNLTPF